MLAPNALLPALALALKPVPVLELVQAPPVVPELVLVLGKGEDDEDEDGAGRSSTGGKRRISISDFRLRGKPDLR